LLFNSLSFGVFLAVVLALYYGPVRGARARKLLLVVSSYLFYASWNPPFALLLLFSTLLDYAIGRRLERAEGTGQRRALLGLSLLGNLGVLGFFKYGDFIAANWLWLDTGLPRERFRPYST
jgi:alginate O-acetyltransferase complex protein AlgI